MTNSSKVAQLSQHPANVWIARFRALSLSEFQEEPTAGQLRKLKRARVWERESPEAFVERMRPIYEEQRRKK